MIGCIACSNPSSSSNGTGNNNEIPTSITSERLLLESVDNGIKVTIIGESGWGTNTWIEDITSDIDIFSTNFDGQNKSTFIYPFTENGKVYKFCLYNQSSGTQSYNSETYEIKALGGSGYPMSDAFTNLTVIPSHNSSGEFLVKFNTTAEKFSDFFSVDISLLTGNKECQPSFGAGILFGYPGECSQISYSNIWMHFDSADGNCVSGFYNLKDNSRTNASNLFELMKTHTFETWVFRNGVNIADYNNLYYAKPEMQIWPVNSDIHYQIRSKKSDKKTFNQFFKGASGEWFSLGFHCNDEVAAGKNSVFDVEAELPGRIF